MRAPDYNEFLVQNDLERSTEAVNKKQQQNVATFFPVAMFRVTQTGRFRLRET
jgi:hypothetical protein